LARRWKGRSGLKEASARRSRGEGEVERGGVTAMEVVIEKRQRPRPNSRGVREVMTTRRMREEEERERMKRTRAGWMTNVKRTSFGSRQGEGEIAIVVVLVAARVLLNDESHGLDCRSNSRSGGLTSKKRFKGAAMPGLMSQGTGGSSNALQ
jgi:hypothetical protein